MAQLATGQGAWSHPDTIGLESANDEGFALWTYKQLLPTIYARYKVDECDFGGHGPQCDLLGACPETIGAVPTFTTIGPPPTTGRLLGPPDTPCNHTDVLATTHCRFQALPGAISTKVWGPLADTCNYRPGDASTKWTFDCNLGVNKNSSVSLAEGTANGWNFPSYCSDYVTDTDLHPCSAASGSVAVGANGRVVLEGTLPNGLDVTSASVELPRLLSQTASLPGLIGGPDGNQAPLPLPLSVHAGRLKAKRMSTGTPSGQLSLGARTAGGRRFMLSVSGVSVGTPAGCQALPASESLATPTVWLNTGFRSATKTGTGGSRSPPLGVASAIPRV